MSTPPVTYDMSSAAKRRILQTGLAVGGLAIFFVIGTALLVWFTPGGNPVGWAILLGVFVILAGGGKEVLSICEREIGLEIDELPADIEPGVLAGLRKTKRNAGDWASACSLYAWIFGLGVVFSAWKELM